MKRLSLLFVALLLSGCSYLNPPAGLSPPDVVKWRADQAIVALDVAQDAAIALNKIQVCATNTPCHPLWSNPNTRLSIDTLTAAAQTIQKIPSGWRATALAAIENLDEAFGEASALHAYLDTARAVVNSVSTKVP